MKKYLAMILGALAMASVGFATTGTWFSVFDEPEMPKSLLNK